MKIVINTENTDLYNVFYRFYKNTSYQIINAKTEAILFENIKCDDVEAFVVAGETYYFKKAVEFIKKEYPYIPVIAIVSPFNTASRKKSPFGYNVSPKPIDLK